MPVRQEASPNLDEVFLPDLQTLPPFDFRLVVNRRAGQRIIRFSNSIWNSGRGILELRGINDQQNNRVDVTQHLYGVDQELLKRSIGRFDYHPEHSHWHWEGFSVYTILTVEPDGEPGEVVASSGKVGYCLFDISPIDDQQLMNNRYARIDTPGRRRYGECTWRRQGISPGWVDTYYSYTPGQEIDVSHLRNGIYALRSTVDPESLIYESNKHNNSAVVYFSLYGNRFHLIGEDITAYLPPAIME